MKGVSLGGTAVSNSLGLIIVAKSRGLVNGCGVHTPLTHSGSVALGGTGGLGYCINVGVSLLRDNSLVGKLTAGAGVYGVACSLTGCIYVLGICPVMSGSRDLLNSLVFAVLTGVSCSTALGTGCGYGSGNDVVSGCLAGDLLGGGATALANLKNVAVGGTACSYNGFLVGVAVKIASFSGGKTGYGVVGEVVGGEYGVSVVVYCLDRLNLSVFIDEPYSDGVNVLVLAESVGNANGDPAVEVGYRALGVVESEVVNGVVTDLLKLVAELTHNGVKVIALKLACGDAYVTLKAIKSVLVKRDA